MKKSLKLLIAVFLLLAWVKTVGAVVSAPVNYQNCMAKAGQSYGKELYGEALENYREALKYKPDSMEARVGAAKVYLAMGEDRKYIGECEKICETYAGDEQIVEMLMEYYLDHNKVKEAVGKIVKLRESYPENETVERYYQKLRGEYEQKYCAYDYISTIVNGYAAYEAEGGWGILAENGEVVVKNMGSSSGVFFSGSDMAPMEENGKAYYVNKSGFKERVPDEAFSYLGVVSGDKILAARNGMFGYVNQKMEPVCEFQWEDATAIWNKLGAVKADGKWAIVNDKLEPVTDYIYEDILYDENRICSVNGLIWAGKDGKYCLVNKEGVEITENIYDDARPFLSEQPTAVKKGLLWGFVDSNGNLAIECQYEDAKPFRNGAAPVKGDLWGYIDQKGQSLIDETFREATPFNENGNAAVKIEDYWTIIRLYVFSS